MLKRILVGLGGSDYTVAAINQAVAIAIAHNAELTGVSVTDPGRVTPFMAMMDQMEREGIVGPAKGGAGRRDIISMPNLGSGL